jgi:hypothetical protein
MSDIQVRLYAGDVDGQFISIDDNACHHRVRVIKDYLQRKGIDRFY